MKTLRETLLRDGYVVIPGLLTAAELDRYRAVLDRHFAARGNIFKLGKTQPNAAAEVPELAPLLSSPKVIAAFRDLLGNQPLVFTGHCDIHSGMFSGWHKDSGPAHGYFEEDCFVADCEVYKIGIYLQDHSDGEGLAVVPGSHHDRDIVDTRFDMLRTRAGDAVIFDVRLTHRGRPADRFDKIVYRINQAVKIGVARVRRKPLRRSDYHVAYQLRQLYDRVAGRRGRHSIFFTFGADNRLTHQFAVQNMVRQLGQNRADQARFPEALVSELEREGAPLSPRLVSTQAREIA